MMFRTTAKGLKFARVEFVPAAGKAIIARLADPSAAPLIDQSSAVQLAAHFAELRSGVTAGFPLQAAKYDRKSGAFLGMQNVLNLDDAIRLNHSNFTDPKGTVFYFMLIGNEPLIGHSLPAPRKSWGAALALAIDSLLKEIRGAAQEGDGPKGFALPTAARSNSIVLAGVAASVVETQAAWRRLHSSLRSAVVVLDAAASSYATRLYAWQKMGTVLPSVPVEDSAAETVDRLLKADRTINWGIAAAAGLGVPIAAMLTGAVTS